MECVAKLEYMYYMLHLSYLSGGTTIASVGDHLTFRKFQVRSVRLHQDHIMGSAQIIVRDSSDFNRTKSDLALLFQWPFYIIQCNELKASVLHGS